MPKSDVVRPDPARSDLQAAEVELTAGPLRWRARAEATPAGLLAVGAMVTGILLSTAVVVWAATSPARERARRRVG